MTEPTLPRPPGDSPDLESTGMPSSRSKYVGRRLGKFRIIGELGRGGMGVVFEALDTVLERHVAIKLLPRSLASRPESLARFLREARAAAQLHHPHVVAVYEADQFSGQYYIVLELVRGGNLLDAVRSGPLDWREATRVMVDACRGLEVAHRAGLIHRDIKPSNLMRSVEGLVKLSDFGLVRPLEPLAGMNTGSGCVMGTPHFMSPEQCRSELADERTDIYGMGATFFFLLTGRPPYPGQSPLLVMNAHLLDPIPDPRRWNAAVPGECVAIIERALAKEPEDRYPSASELLVDLEAALQSAKVVPPPVSGPPLIATFIDAEKETPPTPLLPVRQATNKFAKPNKVASNRLATWSKWLTVSLMAMGGLAVIGRWSPRSRYDAVHTERSTNLRTGEEGGASPSKSPRSVKLADGVAALAAKPNAISSETVTSRRNRREWPSAPFSEVLFRSLGMKPDEPRRESERVSWSMKWPGIVRIGAANSGEFLVVLANGQQPPAVVGEIKKRGPAGYLSVWGRDGRQRVFEELAGRATCLAVSADSRWLAVGEAGEGRVGIWRTSSWLRETGSPPIAGRDIDAVALSEDGRWLALTGHDKSGSQWSLWDVASRRWSAASVGASQSISRSIGFAPEEGLRVMTASDDGNLRLWTQDASWTAREFRTGVPIATFAFAPDRSMVAVGASRYFALWSYLQGKRDHATLTKSGEVRCVAFSPSGKHVCWSAGPTVECFETATLRPVARLGGFPGDVVDLKYTPDGKRLLMATSEGELVLWWME
ncbi:MAG: WD40 repeat domain-containing serine/threonine protein kinase [Pirellulales bacterium]